MLKCVVIGCGWAGRRHMDAINASRRAVLVGAAEADAARRKDISGTYKIPVFPDTMTLLNHILDVDVAVVATIPDLHKGICELLIEAGIQVYCEKPVCRDSEDIRYLKERAELKGVRFGVAFNQRYGDSILKAKEFLLREKSPLHLVTASMYQHLPIKLSDNVRMDFMLTDAICHLLDIVTFLCGPVKEVKAFGSKIGSELYSDIGAALLFSNGAVGTISHSNVGGRLETQHPFQCIDLHTGTCRLCIENQFDRMTVYPHGREERLVFEPSVFRRRDYDVSMTRALEEYLKALEAGEDLPSDIASALANMRVIETMKLSIQNKSEVRL